MAKSGRAVLVTYSIRITFDLSIFRQYFWSCVVVFSTDRDGGREKTGIRVLFNIISTATVGSGSIKEKKKEGRFRQSTVVVLFLMSMEAREFRLTSVSGGSGLGERT